MKNAPGANRLCISCRRTCKQAISAIIASCPRYYPGPKTARTDWKQLEFVFPHGN